MTPPRLVYVSGPLSDPDPTAMASHRRAAVDFGRNLEAAHPVVALVPHSAVIEPADLAGDALWQACMVRCEALLHRCDAVVVLPGWKISRGTLQEIQLAQDLGIPVFFATTFEPTDLVAFAAWLKAARSRCGGSPPTRHPACFSSGE